MKKIISILFAVIAPPVFAGVGPPEPVIVAIPKSAFQKAKPMPTETDEDEVDTAKLAERIAANGKNATDRLAMNDPGRETQNVQERILKDLDKLLNQPPPPPMWTNTPWLRAFPIFCGPPCRMRSCLVWPYGVNCGKT